MGFGIQLANVHASSLVALIYITHYSLLNFSETTLCFSVFLSFFFFFFQIGRSLEGASRALNCFFFFFFFLKEGIFLWNQIIAQSSSDNDRCQLERAFTYIFDSSSIKRHLLY